MNNIDINYQFIISWFVENKNLEQDGRNPWV